MRAGIIGFGLSGKTFHLPLLRASGFDVASIAVRDPAKYGDLQILGFDQFVLHADALKANPACSSVDKCELWGTDHERRVE